MFACGVNNYENASDFCSKLVMCSENDNFYTSPLNQQYDFKDFPNAVTPQSLNTNTRVKQCQQHNMLEENIEISNIPKCVVKYNIDQESYLYGEVHNHNENRRLQSQSSFSYATNTYRKSSLKRKRRRTIFTTEQIIALEEVFKKKPYIHREERIELMKKLHINETSIKVWFQNRRRLSDKKCKDYNLDSPLSESSSESISDRITFIESYVERNSDENGYVTLDDETMGILVDIIDECLPQDIHFENTSLESNTFDITAMYEPISPVSLSENSETQDESVTFENQDLLLGITDYYYF